MSKTVFKSTKHRTHIIINSRDCVWNAFRVLSAHLPLFQRYKPPQKFQTQHGGQRQRSLLLFRALGVYLSGGDFGGLLTAFLESSQGKKIRSDLGNSLDCSKMKTLVQNIKESHSDSLRVVSRVFTRDQLGRLGWVVSKKKFTTSRKYSNLRPLPPNCRRLKPETEQAIKEFYLLHSQPAANKTVYSKNLKCHVPARTYERTIKDLHKMFVTQNPLHNICYSTFRSRKPFNFRQSRNKVDMCEICVAATKNEQAIKKQEFQSSQSNLNSEPLSNHSNGEAEGNFSKSTLDSHMSVGQVSSEKVQTNVFTTHDLETHQSNMKLYELHKKIFQTQRNCFNSDRKDPNPDELVITCDFKENLVVGGVGPVEVGKDFFDRTQVSCLGFCLNYKNGEKTETKYYDFLSHVLSHNALFVKECVIQLMETVKQLLGDIHVVNFWFDCGNHFRNYELLSFLLCEFKEQFNFKIVKVNFLLNIMGNLLWMLIFPYSLESSRKSNVFSLLTISMN